MELNQSGKSVESIRKKYGIHPPFHGIYLNSMDSICIDLGRVKYWFQVPSRYQQCGNQMTNDDYLLSFVIHPLINGKPFCLIHI